MLRALAVLCFISGCDSIFDLEHVSLGDGGARDPDGGNDGDAPDSSLPCFGGNNGGFVSVCLEPNSNDIWQPPPLVDTDGAAVCEMTLPQTNGPALCIIVAANISIGTTLTVVGSRPLVLVATNQLSLSASLLVNSTRVGGSRTGPGANTSTCIPGHGADVAAGGGGGAGGTHGTQGGEGGGGDSSANPGGTAQAIFPQPMPVLRGGCPGGAGGNSLDSQLSGGAGGGAVYLIAGTQLVINGGTIDASGMGGLGGEEKLGGGGGGSGGMIVLDAPAVTLSSASKLIAHGAGGGGGGGATTNGFPGGEPDYGHAQLASAGGIPGSEGGMGGAGTSRSAQQGTSGTNAGPMGGGGGGGGGHGVIRVSSSNFVPNAAVVSPALP